MYVFFDIGARRDLENQSMQRSYQHLDPGGALLIIHQLQYNAEEGWPDWLLGHRARYPEPWPDQGSRRRTVDGDEIELLTRVAEFDPLEQQVVLAMRAQLWRAGAVVKEGSLLFK